MTKANPYLWPLRSRLTFRSARGKLYFSSRDRRLDLADALMSQANNRTLYLDLSSTAGGYWNEQRVAAIEAHIRYDLSFDGYRVGITRLCMPSDEHSCDSPFSWKLVIRST